jgi:hypothetical protein
MEAKELQVGVAQQRVRDLRLGDSPELLTRGFAAFAEDADQQCLKEAEALWVGSVLEQILITSADARVPVDGRPVDREFVQPCPPAVMPLRRHGREFGMRKPDE